MLTKGAREPGPRRGEWEPARSRVSGGTEYTGPILVTTMQFGGQAVRLVRPADPDRMLDDPAVHDWNRRDDYMPYWAYLWPGAYLLAEAVASEPWPEPSSGRDPLAA